MMCETLSMNKAQNEQKKHSNNTVPGVADALLSHHLVVVPWCITWVILSHHQRDLAYHS
jgi:hypothetical protein